MEALSFLPLPFCPATNFLLRWCSPSVHHRIPEPGAMRASWCLAAAPVLLLLKFYYRPWRRASSIASTNTHVIRVLRWVGYHQFVWGSPSCLSDDYPLENHSSPKQEQNKVNVANCTVESWESPFTDLTEYIPKGKTLEPPVCRHFCFFHPSLFFSWFLNR